MRFRICMLVKYTMYTHTHAQASFTCVCPYVQYILHIYTNESYIVYMFYVQFALLYCCCCYCYSACVAEKRFGANIVHV